MGGEVKMVPALPAMIRGSVGDPADWAGDLELGQVEGLASENLPELAWCEETYHHANRWRGAGGRFSPANGETAAALATCRQWGLDRLAVGRRAFMGHEAFGRTYPGWHYMGKRAALPLALALGWDDLAAELRGWLRAFLAWSAVCSGRSPGREVRDHKLEAAGLGRAAGVVSCDGPPISWGGRFVAWSGDRCASREGDAKSPEYGKFLPYLSLSPMGIWLELEIGARPASGTTEGEVMAALRESFGAVGESATGGCVLSADDVDALRAARDGDVGACLRVLEWCREWLPEVPFRVQRTAASVTSVSPRGRGSSTTHVYATTCELESGIGRHLYADPGWRSYKEPPPKWIGPGTATVEALEGGGLRIRAQRDDAAFGPPVVLETLGGGLELDVETGPDGLRVLFPVPEAPAVPVAPDPPAGGAVAPVPAVPSRPRKRRGLAALLEALRRLFGGRR
ncbi:MAG: hypothetical protein IPQ07_40005 [Myxococcales bacterium]|nr:hypothetical protein [Myxococcales bacterium]